jgi:hypothetical protein
MNFIVHNQCKFLIQQCIVLIHGIKSSLQTFCQHSIKKKTVNVSGNWEIMPVLCYFWTFFFKGITRSENFKLSWLYSISCNIYLTDGSTTVDSKVIHWHVTKTASRNGVMVAEGKKWTYIHKGLLEVYDGATMDVTFVQQWVSWVKEAETREGDFLTNCGVWT